MKKRTTYLVLFLIILFSIPYLTSAFHQPVLAATSATKSTVLPIKVPLPTPISARVEYVLPYPGILPDNPLYFLKNLRDKIIEMLISDPMNKAEFYILQADKKLNMSVMLAGSGKSTLAQEVLTQALVSRTQAVVFLETTVQSGKQVPGFVVEKLTLSLRKHQEVLTDMKKGTDAVAALLVRVQQLVIHPK